MAKPIPFLKLFRYASREDLILLGIACIFILYSSLNIPLVNIVYGLMMREMNDYVSRRAQILNETLSATITTTAATLVTTVTTTISTTPFATNYSTSSGSSVSPEYLATGYDQQVNNGSLEDAQSLFINNSYNLCMIVIVFGITRFVALYLALLFFSRAAANQAKRVKVLFFKSLLRQEVAWFERNRTGDFALRISSDLTKFEEGIGEKIALCLNALFAWMSSLISSFYYGWELTLVCLVLVPLTIFITTLIAEFQASYSMRENSALSRAFNVCHEVISSIRTVLSFSGQEKEAARFKRGLDSAYRYGLNRNVFAALNLGFTWMSGYLGFAICLLYSTKFYKPEYYGLYDEAHIITILWSAAGCVFLLNRMMPFIEIIQMARASASNLFAVIERRSPIDVTSSEGLRPSHFEASVAFNNVHFAYPNGRDETPDKAAALEGMSMEVKAGQTIALVGPSGSGKSTALGLMQRFYDIDSGSITIGGHDIRQLNLAWLRGLFGVVTQEPVLFDMSIADNIRLGARPGQTLTDYDVEQAARSANAHAFIKRLPAGYETRAGSRGVQLSGGQKQRIAIARALARHPKILLLDEATSALDLESESVVQRALDQARIGRTTFIVAHRLSTVRNADKIVVFEKGAIVEQGSHEELLQNKGLYYQISQQQRQGIDLLPVSRRNSQIGCHPLNTVAGDHLVQYTRESRSLSVYSATGKYAATGGFSAAGHGGNGEGVDNGGGSCAAPAEPNDARITDDDYYNRNEEDDSDTSGQNRVLFNEDTQASLLEGDSAAACTAAGGLHQLTKAKRTSNLSVLNVLRFIQPNVGWSLLGVFTSLLMGLCIPISAMIIGDIATIFSTDNRDQIRQGLFSHGLLYTGLAMFAFFVSFVQVVSFGVAGEKIGIQLRLRGFQAIMRHDIPWFDQKRNNPGSVCARLASDVGNVQSITGNRTAVIFQSISILVSTFIFAVYYNPTFSSVCAMFVAILLISTVLQARYAGKLALANRNFDSRIGKIVLESSSNIKTLVSLHQEDYFIECCEQLVNKDRRSQSLDNHLRLSLESLKYAMTAISKGSSFYFAAHMLLRDQITIDTIFKLIEIILYGLTEASKSLIFISDLEKARIGTQNLYKLIYGSSNSKNWSGEADPLLAATGNGAETSCLINNSKRRPSLSRKGGAARGTSATGGYLPRLLLANKDASGYKRLPDYREPIEQHRSLPSGDPSAVLANLNGSLPACKARGQLLGVAVEEEDIGQIRCEGNIRFNAVRFHYPTRPDACVLKSLDIDIPAGKTVALVGRSGCGKSTIVQLLERFYEHSHGQILFDGSDILQLPTEWVRRQIALVSQEPSLLSYTIGDNIRYGDNSRHVGLDEVVQAAQTANIHEFIMSLPEGYDTVLSEANSVQLSGGQKQRIAIARALIRQAPILVFDEATSALDTKSEHIVQEALDRARVGRTSIIIAHRLSTIQNADKIVVLKEGSVVEQGSHEELLDKKGEYYCLYKTHK